MSKEYQYITLPNGRIVRLCPCCGGRPDGAKYVIEGAVWCKKCRLTMVRKHSSGREDGLGKAITVWNRRYC